MIKSGGGRGRPAEKRDSRPGTGVEEIEGSLDLDSLLLGDVGHGL
jgi:hypothetical protein